jgi:hypothetical protein
MSMPRTAAGRRLSQHGPPGPAPQASGHVPHGLIVRGLDEDLVRLRPSRTWSQRWPPTTPGRPTSSTYPDADPDFDVVYAIRQTSGSPSG